MTQNQENHSKNKLLSYTINTLLIGVLAFEVLYMPYNVGYRHGETHKKREIVSNLKQEGYNLAIGSISFENIANQDSLITSKLDSLEKVIMSLQSMDN